VSAASKISSRGRSEIDYSSEYLANKFKYNEVKFEEFKRAAAEDPRPFVVGDLGAGRIMKNNRKKNRARDISASKNNSAIVSFSTQNKSHIRNNSYGKIQGKDKIDRLILKSLQLDDEPSVSFGSKILDESTNENK
jgi:hypothetical protein